jgi:hypothetical protein
MYKPAKEISSYPDILFQIFGGYSDFWRYLISFWVRQHLAGEFLRDIK